MDNKGKIYRLVCNKTGQQYIGSTVQKYLSKRKAHHKEKYFKWLNGNGHYVTSFEIVKGDDFDIVLIELVDFNDKHELHTRERYWIEKSVCVNKCIPNLSLHEIETCLPRRNDPKYQKEYKAQYRTSKIDCQCGSTYRNGDRARHERSQKHQTYLKTINEISH